MRRSATIRQPRPASGRPWRWALPALLLAVTLAACSNNGGTDDSSSAGPRALASLEVFADMARNVGGDRAEVTALLPPGADPHTFELAPGRVADIARADLVFVNGLGLEGNLMDVIEENAGGPVVELATGIDTLDGNPHLWLDAQLAARYVERIRDALIDQDPKGRDVYEVNADAYLAQLGDLDSEVQAAIEAIPADKRKLVTFHDAFPYLAKRYGLEVVAVVAPSPGQEPSARDVAELAGTLSSEGVPAVFAEPQFSSRVLDLAADDAGIRVLELLSGAFTEDVRSYIDLMRFNARELQEGLGDE